MSYSNVLRSAVSAAVSSSLLLSACAKKSDNTAAPKAAANGTAAAVSTSGTAKPAPVNESIEKLMAGDSTAAELTAKLPIFSQGYTNETMQTFAAYVAGEASTKKMVEQIDRLKVEEFIVVRLQIQTAIQQMKDAKVYSKDVETRVRDLSVAINGILQKKSKNQMDSEFKAYGGSFLMGMAFGLLPQLSVVNRTNQALEKLAETSAVKKIRQVRLEGARAKWSRQFPNAATPSVTFAGLNRALAAHYQGDKAFFVEILAQATQTDIRQMRNVGVETLGAGSDSVKKYLGTEEIVWAPTLVEGVMQARNGNNLVYRVTVGKKIAQVGFKDLGEDVISWTAGNESTRRLVEVIAIQNQKQARLIEMQNALAGVEYSTTVSNVPAGVSASEAVHLAAKAEVAKLEKNIANLKANYFDGKFDAHILDLALASADGRIHGKKLYRDSLRARTAGMPESAEKKKLVDAYVAVDREIMQYENLDISVGHLKGAQAKLATLQDGSAEANVLKEKVASLEKDVAEQTGQVIRTEIAQAPQASAHYGNQSYATTLSKSTQPFNDTVSVIVPGIPYPVAVGMSSKQLLSNNARTTIDILTAGTVFAFLLGGLEDLVEIEDGWTAISPAELDAAIKSVAQEETKKK